MFHLKPAYLEVVVMFLVSLLLGALLGTSSAKAREQCYLVLKFLRKLEILTINAFTETN